MNNLRLRITIVTTPTSLRPFICLTSLQHHSSGRSQASISPRSAPVRRTSNIILSVMSRSSMRSFAWPPQATFRESTANSWTRASSLCGLGLMLTTDAGLGSAIPASCLPKATCQYDRWVEAELWQAAPRKGADQPASFQAPDGISGRSVMGKIWGAPWGRGACAYWPFAFSVFHPLFRSRACLSFSAFLASHIAVKLNVS